MINTGIIRNISNTDIFVEPYSSESKNDGASCGAGGCESCGHSAKKRLIQVLNPENFNLTSGSIVEFEISSSEVLIGAFRVLLFPVILFIVFYLIAHYSFHWNEQARVLAGLSGFVSAFLLNYLTRKKSDKKKMPEIIRVL